MGLESATTIAGLNANWPLGTDARSQGDDHLRLIKRVIKLDALSMAAGGIMAANLGLGLNVSLTAEDATGVQRAVVRSVNGGIFQLGNTAFATQQFLGTWQALTLSATLSAAGYLESNGFFVGATPAGANAADRISRKTGGTFIVQSGITGGSPFAFRDSADTTIARVDAPGTGAAATVTIMTREKGDGRYVLQTSSRRFKEAVAAAEEPIAGAGELAPSRWTWGGELYADDPRRGKPGYGLIAEEVAEVLPEAVLRDGEGRPQGLDPLALIGMLVAEVNSLQARMSQLEVLE